MGDTAGDVISSRDELIAGLEKDLAGVDQKLIPEDVALRLIDSSEVLLMNHAKDPLIVPVILKLFDALTESTVAESNKTVSGAEIVMTAMMLLSAVGGGISPELETGVAQKLPQVFYKLAAENEEKALDAADCIEGMAMTGRPIANAMIKTVTTWQQDKKATLDLAVATLTQNLRAVAEARRDAAADAFGERQRQLKALAPKIKIRPAASSPG